MESSFEQLNPQIKEITIGIKKLEKIKIYPLSMADQLQLTSLFVECLKELLSSKEDNNIVFAQTIQKLLKENLSIVLNMVTDTNDNLLSKITNVQAMDIAELVYSMNYQVLEIKVKALVLKMTPVFQSKISSEDFSEDTLNTDSMIYSEKTTETED
jgi:hypothetical protein